MKPCDNCGEVHPRWWLAIRMLWAETPRHWSDSRRFAYALLRFYSWSKRGRDWWVRQMLSIVQERIQREIAEQDMIIQLERDDPRVGGLMMYLSNRQRGDN